jgi:multiple sugar transport system permease protein
VLVALIFRYILAFRLFSEVWLLTGGGPARTTEVMAIYLYKQAFTYANFGQGAATGWVMVLASGVFAVAYVRLLHRRSFAGA